MSSDEGPEERQSVSPEEVWENLDQTTRERTLRLLVELALRLLASREKSSGEGTSHDLSNDDL
jgi:hypothetical protein